MSAHFLEKGIDTSHTGILYVEGLTVNFDGFRAINNLSLTIDVGELRCVIGPNGAGKTTLMDVITGKTRSNIAEIEGSVYLGSTIDLMTMNEPQIAQIGVGRKFQKPTVFEHHPVWENLELAMAGDKTWHHSLVAKVDLEGRRLMEAVLALTQLESEAYRDAGLLSHGQKQRLEIGMLLMQQPKLLLLDEPVAGMTDEETMRLQCSMVVVEHDMEFVAALAGDKGKVTVLAEGSVLAEGTLDQVQRDERVIESYLGR